MKLERLTAGEEVKLLKLFGLFVLLGAFLLLVLRPLVSSAQVPVWTPWLVLCGCAAGWFGLELHVEKPDRQRLGKALSVALFLVLFDFAFENSGTLLGLWYSSNSLVPVCVPVESAYPACVPIEVMTLILFGAAAWALHVPQELNLTYSILDIILIAAFGAVGEYVLIQFGLMHYLQWWTSLHAFVSYLGTWMLLHVVKYKVFR